MDTTSPITVTVITGSVREGRFSEHAAAWIAAELQKNDSVSVDVLDLRDYEMPFFNEAETPAFKSKPYEHEAVVRFTAKIAAGDAFVIVTPEYNRGTSGVLKNALDWVYQEWNSKPVAFVSYGSVGGARAVEQLRLSAIELQMAPIRTAVHFPGEDFYPVLFGKADAAPMFEKYTEKGDEMIDQLLWWARALKAARESS